MNLEELRTIPKVDLHRHLECSLRRDTLQELAEKRFKKSFTATELNNEFLITEPMKSLESVLKKFLQTQSLLGSEEVLSRLTFEATEDALNEGIRILELRWSPTFILEGHPNLSFDKIIRAIRNGQKRAESLPITTGHIAIVQRTRPAQEAEKIIDFAIENKDFFVGVDLADNEEGFDPKPFQKAFEKARAHGLHVTIHAGEPPIPTASLNIKNSIEYLGAERIGHGIQVLHDPFVSQILKQKMIPLEVSIKSNWLTRSCSSLEEHPIRALMKLGIPVTINTDDPGVFATNLNEEYQILQKHHQFKIEDFDRCNDIAAQASFIPLIKKQKFWPRPIHILKNSF
jgi:adenosine deaminase